MKIDPILETWLMLNAQAPAPLHPAAEPLPPLQPLKAEPEFGEAVRLTAVL
jgi:hypothetical protein